jgi:hypothetical protein
LLVFAEMLDRFRGTAPGKCSGTIFESITRIFGTQRTLLNTIDVLATKHIYELSDKKNSNALEMLFRSIKYVRTQ